MILPENVIDSAVLVPIYRGVDGRLRLVLIRRSPGGIHGDQLAFPGGKHELGDGSMRATALREAQEEIGLAPDQVHILSELPPVETKTTGFRIFPFLALIASQEWVVDKHEVAEVIDIDLEALAEPSRYGEEDFQHDTWPAPRRIAFYKVDNFKLWGASFRILHLLLPRILAREWQI